MRATRCWRYHNTVPWTSLSNKETRQQGKGRAVRNHGRGRVKILMWMNFLVKSNLSAFSFFSTWKLSTFLFFYRTSFNVKGMQSLAQFNHSTAQGDSLFGVSIFAKFDYRFYRERNEVLNVSHQEPINRSLPLPYKPSESTFARIFLFLEHCE